MRIAETLVFHTLGQAHIEKPVGRHVLQGRFGPKGVIPADRADGGFKLERVAH